jgi:MSHA pilin protein MshA
LPKFSSLSGDARYASLKAAQGALATVASSTHGKFMIDGKTSPTVEGVQLTLVNGYPTAVQATADAAGLTNDYTVYSDVAAASATQPAVTTGTMAIVPNNIKDTAKAVNCYIVYTQSPDANTPATVTLGTNTTSANCD